jgi:hypothetical protein
MQKNEQLFATLMQTGFAARIVCSCQQYCSALLHPIHAPYHFISL